MARTLLTTARHNIAQYRARCPAGANRPSFFTSDERKPERRLARTIEASARASIGSAARTRIRHGNSSLSSDEACSSRRIVMRDTAGVYTPATALSPLLQPGGTITLYSGFTIASLSAFEMAKARAGPADYARGEWKKVMPRSTERKLVPSCSLPILSVRESGAGSRVHRGCIQVRPNESYRETNPLFPSTFFFFFRGTPLHAPYSRRIEFLLIRLEEQSRIDKSVRDSVIAVLQSGMHNSFIQ